MRQSETIAALAVALAKVQGEMNNVIADTPGQVGHQKYKYATLGQMWDMARPILAKHELAVVQGPIIEGDLYALKTLLLHKSGEWLETAVYPLQVDAPQQMGKAITYGRRYSLAPLLGIAAEEDTDAVGVELKKTEDIPLGMVKGDGPTRFASHPLSAHLQDEMKDKTLLDDLQSWWVEKQPSIKRLNSENRHLLFMEFMKQGFELAPAALDLRVFLKLHKDDIETLEKRSHKEYEGLLDHYDKAKARFQTEEVS